MEKINKRLRGCFWPTLPWKGWKDRSSGHAIKVSRTSFIKNNPSPHIVARLLSQKHLNQTCWTLSLKRYTRSKLNACSLWRKKTIQLNASIVRSWLWKKYRSIRRSSNIINPTNMRSSKSYRCPKWGNQIAIGKKQADCRKFLIVTIRKRRGPN